MTYYTRSDWGARPANGGPGNLTVSRVEGVALHWPAMSNPVRGFANVAAALRGWQNFHMDGRGWSDIAYQEAFDQEGNVYALRGLATQSGANGGTDVNERFGAFLLILAPGEKPTAKMMRAVRARVKAFRRRYPEGVRVVGHGDIRPGGSECPGPMVQSLVAKRAFEPRVTTIRTRGPRLDLSLTKLGEAHKIAVDKNQKRKAGIIAAAIGALTKVKARRK